MPRVHDHDMAAAPGRSARRERCGSPAREANLHHVAPVPRAWTTLPEVPAVHKDGRAAAVHQWSRHGSVCAPSHQPPQGPALPDVLLQLTTRHGRASRGSEHSAVQCVPPARPW